MRFPRPFARKEILWPTWTGWLLLAALVAGPALLWFFCAEAWLSRTERKNASLLVVEGWIQDDGLVAAAREFADGRYTAVITTGEFIAPPSTPQRWSFADVAARVLVRCHLPAGAVFSVPTEYSERSRTFEAAVAVRDFLRQHPEFPGAAVNVFTAGPHARRSQLVYKKVLGPGTSVGVIAWSPETKIPWWKSSNRSKEVVVETGGWFFELLFSSGRGLD